jgi:signal transduction histidine kinase
LGFGVLLAMLGFAAVGYYSIRRDIQNLRVISQDNILWTAMQLEVELLRFQLAVAHLEAKGAPEALDTVRERFDILWSRFFMEGRVGDLMEIYDQGHGSVAAFREYLEELDPALAALEPGHAAQLRLILQELETFQRDLRLYTLRVVRADTAASREVRDRIQRNSQTTIAISLAAALLSVLALALMLRDNRVQRQVAELNRRLAEEAERSSRAKSRFLTMMSHELRNPLNGVLGPLALLGQRDLPVRSRRLVEQAQHSGKAMVQMLSGLLDYGELQDGRFRLRVEPFRIAALAAGVEAELAEAGASGVRVTADAGGPEFVQGDLDRLRRIFVHLVEHMLERGEQSPLDLSFRHDGERLFGEITFAGERASVDWKLDLVTGLNEIPPDQLASDALRPLIVRGLIAAAEGVLTLEDADGRRAVHVAIPAPPLRYERIRVRLETRSAALSAIYKAALKSDRIVFIGAEEAGPVDMVLVDATSVGEEPLMEGLRARFADALFVSLGAPQRPETFDDVVESPADMSRLRSRILGRLAS